NLILSFYTDFFAQPQSNSLCFTHTKEEFELLSEVIAKYLPRPMYILMPTMLMSLSLITVLAVLYGISMNPPTRYLLVIDCELSACTFSLFKYTDWYGRSHAWIHQRSHYTISLGTSSFGENLTAGAAVILQETKAVIAREVPVDLRKNTRIFFGASASIRMLKKTNAEKVERLMVAVRNALAKSAPEGIVVSALEDVKVVSGAEQGFYAWLAVNYLMGIFRKVRAV
ncbi:Ectonucleoside triphosphate diphosphohydrolase 1, partial [Taenia solium]